MNFIFVAFPVLPLLGMARFPSISPTTSNRSPTSSFAVPPLVISVLLLHAFSTPYMPDLCRLSLRSFGIVSRNFVGCSPMLMSNDQYSSASSLPKDHLSGTTDQTHRHQCFPFSKTGANATINSTATSGFPLPNNSSNSICRR